MAKADPWIVHARGGGMGVHRDRDLVMAAAHARAVALAGAHAVVVRGKKLLGPRVTVTHADDKFTVHGDQPWAQDLQDILDLHG